LDLLKWHNLALLVSATIVFCFVIARGISAMIMAYAQLGEALILRSLFNVLVWMRLGGLAADPARKGSVAYKSYKG